MALITNAPYSVSGPAFTGYAYFYGVVSFLTKDVYTYSSDSVISGNNLTIERGAPGTAGDNTLAFVCAGRTIHTSIDKHTYASDTVALSSGSIGIGTAWLAGASDKSTCSFAGGTNAALTPLAVNNLLTISSETVSVSTAITARMMLAASSTNGSGI